MPDNELGKKIENIPTAEQSFDEEREVSTEREFSPEKTVETRESLDRGREAVLKEIEDGGSSEFTGGLAGSSNIRKEKQQKIKEVEKILEEDMEEVFVSLPPKQQEEFKKGGEEATRKIIFLLEKARVKMGDIIKIIKRWLSIVPGINKFFLEQESKIKADEIIKIKRQ